MPTRTARGAGLIIILALLSGIAPMSMHIILPALPVLQDAFASDEATVQLVLSLSLFSVAFATLGYGPTSDRYGRKPVLLAGLIFFVAGSVICVVAPTITVLIAGRILQAVGGAAAMVLGRAIIRDLYDRETAARMMAYMITALVVAPMVAPLIGSLIQAEFGWRAIFVFIAGIGVAQLLFAFPRVPETRPSNADVQTLGGMLLGFIALLRMPMFLAYAGQVAFGMGMFMAFVGAAPYVTVRVLGRPPTEFGLWFIVVSVGFMIGTAATGRFGGRLGLDRTMRLGSLLGVVFGLLMLALTVAGIREAWAVFVPGALMAFANGLAMPNAQAGGLSVNPRIAGTAAGLLSFVQMLSGAVFAQVAGMVHDGTPYPMVIVMLTAAVLALACVLGLPLLAGRRARAGVRDATDRSDASDT